MAEPRYAQVINNPSDSDEILEMHGRFDLLLKLRARNRRTDAGYSGQQRKEMFKGS